MIHNSAPLSRANCLMGKFAYQILENLGITIVPFCASCDVV